MIICRQADHSPDILRSSPSRRTHQRTHTTHRRCTTLQHGDDDLLRILHGTTITRPISSRNKPDFNLLRTSQKLLRNNFTFFGLSLSMGRHTGEPLALCVERHPMTTGSLQPTREAAPLPSEVAPIKRRCTCCGEFATFRYIGTQYFPKQISTLRPGSKSSLTLWTCDTCATTLSNLE